MEGQRRGTYRRIGAVTLVAAVLILAVIVVPSHLMTTTTTTETATVTQTATTTVDQSVTSGLTALTDTTAVQYQLSPPLTQLWTLDEPVAPENVQSLPHIRTVASDNESVYVVSYDPPIAGNKSSVGSYALMRIDTATGATAWTTALPIPAGNQSSYHTGGITLVNDSVIVTVGDYMMSYTKQGLLSWGAIDNSTMFFPLVHTDRIYTATGIFKAETGAKVCSYRGGEVQVFGHGSIYSINGTTLYAFDDKTCALLWTETLGSQPQGSPSFQYPVYSNDTDLLFASDSHNVYEIAPKTGNIAQVYTFGQNIYAPPAVYDDEIYISEGASPTSCNCSVVAVNLITGAVNWRTSGFTSAPLQPVVNGTYVYVTSGCKVSALDTGTGVVAWSWVDERCSPAGILSPPSISDGQYLTAEAYANATSITTLVTVPEASTTASLSGQ